jgi:hypothetical protein
MSKRYVVIAHMPACSAVLFVNPRLEEAHRITIHLEHTREACEWYTRGFRAGSGQRKVEVRDSIELPAGNPASSYALLLAVKR